MTRRERMENRAARRRDWAASANAKAAGRHAAASEIAHGIPMGQPVLVGHHSERRHRRDLERMDRSMRAACELDSKARDHASKAATLERRLESTIFSDDADAIAALEARIAERERERERTKQIAKAWRKGGRDAVAEIAGERIADECARTMKQCSWLKSPVSTTHISAAIRRDRERIEQIKREREQHAKAAAAGGVTIERAGDRWCTVTFAEKPAREILQALKAAGFHWSGGAWHGPHASLPADVAALVNTSSAGASH